MRLVYCPWCHWLWGGGFLARWGARDFAGGIVVHVTAGFGALASLFVVGAASFRAIVLEGFEISDPSSQLF